MIILKNKDCFYISCSKEKTNNTYKLTLIGVGKNKHTFTVTDTKPTNKDYYCFECDFDLDYGEYDFELVDSYFETITKGIIRLETDIKKLEVVVDTEYTVYDDTEEGMTQTYTIED